MSGWGAAHMCADVKIASVDEPRRSIMQQVHDIPLDVEDEHVYREPMPPAAKKFEIIDGYTIKYHANGVTRWSKGAIEDGKPTGYWEWYRIDGTLKRSGNFDAGEPVGEWITYNQDGEPYKVTQRG